MRLANPMETWLSFHGYGSKIAQSARLAYYVPRKVSDPTDDVLYHNAGPCQCYYGVACGSYQTVEQRTKTGKGLSR
jgi:hypothetical protein